MNTLKDCTTPWRYLPPATPARVISLFKQLVVALDTIFHERKYQEAKGIREDLLTQTLIMALLLLAEVVVLIKRFCTFLKTCNPTYSLIIGKSERLFSLKEKVGKSLPHQESLDSSLKYFSKEQEQFSFAKESS